MQTKLHSINIQNQSMAHPFLAQLSKEQQDAEINVANKTL